MTGSSRKERMQGNVRTMTHERSAWKYRHADNRRSMPVKAYTETSYEHALHCLTITRSQIISCTYLAGLLTFNGHLIPKPSRGFPGRKPCAVTCGHLLHPAMEPWHSYGSNPFLQLRVQCTILTYFPILRLLNRHQVR